MHCEQREDISHIVRTGIIAFGFQPDDMAVTLPEALDLGF